MNIGFRRAYRSLIADRSLLATDAGCCRCRGCCRAWHSHHRPSGPPGRCGVSAAQRRPSSVVAWVVDLKGCDHAARAPTAYLVTGRTDFIVRPGGARYDIVRSVKRCRVVVPAQCQTRHPEVARFPACFGAVAVPPRKAMTPIWRSAPQEGRLRDGSSTRRMQQPPGYSSDFVEELESVIGLFTTNGICPGKKSKVAVNLFRRSVGDAPVVDPVSTATSMALCEVRRHRRCRPDHLVRDRLKGSGYLLYEQQCRSRRFDGLLGGDEVRFRERVVHGYLRVVHALPPVDGISVVKGSPAAGDAFHPLTTEIPSTTCPRERPGGDHEHRVEEGVPVADCWSLVAVPAAVAAAVPVAAVPA